MHGDANRHRTRVMGRVLRLLVGAGLVWMTWEVMVSEDASFNVRVAGVFVALTVFYAAAHLGITRFAPEFNPWFGAVIAVIPVVLVYLLGGPVGRVASVAYVGVSLVIQVARGDAGCEVMSVPGLLLGRRTHLVCIVFSPIDWLEARIAGRRSS